MEGINGVTRGQSRPISQSLDSCHVHNKALEVALLARTCRGLASCGFAPGWFLDPFLFSSCVGSSAVFFCVIEG